jgi:nucleotide-binding universal stress UspA family protein
MTQITGRRGEERRANDGGPDGAHRRPAGVSDETVAALGKLGEALECTERARGHLYSLHQLTGHADLMLDEAADLLRRAGHDEFADRLERELIGRNVIAGRWTFQLVEDYDDHYYAAFRALESAARETLADGRRHLFEAELKERRRTHGRPGHEARPAG